MKNIAILGSTGSIGCNALAVARRFPSKFCVKVLAAKSQIDLLEQQAREFKPELIAVFDKEKAQELQKRIPHIEVVAGMEGLEAAASYDSVEQVISAMAGTLGLVPTIAAIRAGKNIGLANKEVLVSGGALVMSLVKEKGITFLPIDSEHSAIFQCLNGERHKSVQRLILTATGGPFRTYTDEQLRSVTVDRALCHPTWKMGPKVTIDCSTLMNKGLEVIEAHWLFNIPLSQIDVVIHPQSIIHSMVEFQDGSILAQMGEPNMIVPIQYAMTYPERQPGAMPPFDFFKNSRLEFMVPDKQRFPCLSLAYQALERGGSLPCYMNAANEVLVDRCLKKDISWHHISEKLGALMKSHSVHKVETLDALLAIDEEARREAQRA